MSGEFEGTNRDCMASPFQQAGALQRLSVTNAYRQSLG